MTSRTRHCRIALTSGSRRRRCRRVGTCRLHRARRRCSQPGRRPASIRLGCLPRIGSSKTVGSGCDDLPAWASTVMPCRPWHGSSQRRRFGSSCHWRSLPQRAGRTSGIYGPPPVSRRALSRPLVETCCPASAIVAGQFREPGVLAGSDAFQFAAQIVGLAGTLERARRPRLVRLIVLSTSCRFRWRRSSA
jgi:hypothetical protein